MQKTYTVFIMKFPENFPIPPEKFPHVFIMIVLKRNSTDLKLFFISM